MAPAPPHVGRKPKTRNIDPRNARLAAIKRAVTRALRQDLEPNEIRRVVEDGNEPETFNKHAAQPRVEDNWLSLVLSKTRTRHSRHLSGAEDTQFESDEDWQEEREEEGQDEEAIEQEYVPSKPKSRNIQPSSQPNPKRRKTDTESTESQDTAETSSSTIDYTSRYDRDEATFSTATILIELFERAEKIVKGG
ncbi:hypothetical protein DV735_g1296, partial [Chaetothyriales sp. CBS 134920]